jgi:hypothetical protein
MLSFRVQLFFKAVRQSTDALLGKPYYFSHMKQIYLY